jgi:DNA-binding transcriptional ArsR family regulator
MDTIFKALADPTRRQILKLLRRGEMSAGELAEQFPISAPSMSHHFSLLKQAELVTAKRRGQQIVYALNTTVFQDVVAVLLDLLTPEAEKGVLPESGPAEPYSPSGTVSNETRSER